MIFNREWYELHEGRAEFDEYRSRFNRLTPSRPMASFQESRNSTKRLSAGATKNLRTSWNPAAYSTDLRELPTNLQRVAEFYIPISKKREAEIREKQRSRANSNKTADIRLTSEEIVEDAGLNDDVVEPARHKHKRSTEASQWA